MITIKNMGESIASKTLHTSKGIDLLLGAQNESCIAVRNEVIPFIKDSWSLYIQ